MWHNRHFYSQFLTTHAHKSYTWKQELAEQSIQEKIVLWEIAPYLKVRKKAPTKLTAIKECLLDFSATYVFFILACPYLMINEIHTLVKFYSKQNYKRKHVKSYTAFSYQEGFSILFRKSDFTTQIYIH